MWSTDNCLQPPDLLTVLSYLSFQVTFLSMGNHELVPPPVHNVIISIFITAEEGKLLSISVHWLVS